MLYVYCGNDPVQVRAAAREKIGELEVMGQTLSVIDSDSYATGVLHDAVGASSLFGEQYVYLLDMPSEQKEFQEECTEQLSAMSESTNAFVVIEGALLAAAKNRCKSMRLILLKSKKHRPAGLIPLRSRMHCY